MGMLDDKVVIVTGAGRKRGIGRAIALRLAQDGAHVVVSSQRRDPATFPENEKAEGWLGVRSLAEEIRALGRRAVAVDCDVTRADQVQALIDAATRELGGIDGLVNNAGIPSGAGSAPIVEMDDELWYRTVDVNLNGVYLASKAAARAMIRGGKGGAIVNISSTAGRMGFAVRRLLCDKIRADRPDATNGFGARQARHPRQLRLPRLDRHGHDGRHVPTHSRKGRHGFRGHQIGCARLHTDEPSGAPRGAGRGRGFPPRIGLRVHDRTDVERRRRLEDGLIRVERSFG
jgi:NAD(P)-dependent dehydrogenase (short-subunit alcohol dehydrogenase family)